MARLWATHHDTFHGVGNEKMWWQQAQLRAAEDVIARSSIRAPIAGTVVGLQVHTSGGVIKAGEPLRKEIESDERQKEA